MSRALTDNEREELVKSNLNLLMRSRDIKNLTKLADILGLSASTLYSFYSNPLSKSKAKKAIADYFNISIEDLEFKNLSEVISDNEYISFGTYNNDISDNIVSMSDSDINKLLVSSKSEDEYIEKLKAAISRSYKTSYRHYMEQAKSDYSLGNYQKALCSISAAFWLLEPEDIDLIKNNDLKLYVEIAKRFNDESLIKKLVDLLISNNYFNEKIITILGNLLEDSFKIYSRICYETVINGRK